MATTIRMKAKFNSNCSACNEPISKGQELIYHTKRKYVECTDCGLDKHEQYQRDLAAADFDERVYNFGERY